MYILVLLPNGAACFFLHLCSFRLNSVISSRKIPSWRVRMECSPLRSLGYKDWPRGPDFFMLFMLGCEDADGPCDMFGLSHTAPKYCKHHNHHHHHNHYHNHQHHRHHNHPWHKNITILRSSILIIWRCQHRTLFPWLTEVLQRRCPSDHQVPRKNEQPLVLVLTIDKWVGWWFQYHIYMAFSCFNNCFLMIFFRQRQAPIRDGVSNWFRCGGLDTWNH